MSEHNFPVDIVGIFIEINLRETKWPILKTYRPPSQSIDYFLENVNKTLNIYSQKYDKFLLWGDFNSEKTIILLKILLKKFGCGKNLF